MRKYLYIISLILFAACAPSDKQANRPAVSVSILPLKYFVDNISGGDFDVTVIVPPGASPETYEPSPSQLKNVTDSKLYFELGLVDFEKSIKNSISGTLPIVTLGQKVSVMHGDHYHEGEVHSGSDPHIWLSPGRMKIISATILKELSGVNPDSASKYEENYKSLSESIDSLNSYIVRSFKDLRIDTFLINHPFLSYYADDYGIIQLSVEHEGKDPMPERLISLYDVIRKTGINTIFFQSQSGVNAVKALSEETGTQMAEVDPLAYQWLDNMYDITDKLAKSMR